MDIPEKWSALIERVVGNPMDSSSLSIFLSTCGTAIAIRLVNKSKSSPIATNTKLGMDKGNTGSVQVDVPYN